MQCEDMCVTKCDAAGPINLNYFLFEKAEN